MRFWPLVVFALPSLSTMRPFTHLFGEDWNLVGLLSTSFKLPTILWYCGSWTLEFKKFSQTSSKCSLEILESKGSTNKFMVGGEPNFGVSSSAFVTSSIVE